MSEKIPTWVNDAVFYQIYPQSFNDSNSDGIGDIPGIIEKLDYLEWLGVNVLWLNPCFESPFRDAGYDVSNYYKVAGRYGKNSDLKRLFRHAHKRGMRVCLDLVAGHTSVDHPWFRESCRREDNKYSDWYIWTDSIWENMTEFGLECVKGYSGRDGNYATNFFWSQPALNYGFAKPDSDKKWQQSMKAKPCRDVLSELKNIMKFWLDMGCDGFRVDMASSLIKNDPGKKATSQLWKKVRSEFDKEYPHAVLIAEWFDPKVSINAGFHIDFPLISGIVEPDVMLRGSSESDLYGRDAGGSFFSRTGSPDVNGYFSDYISHLKKIDKKGYIGVYTGSHDIKRASLGRSKLDMEMVFAFVLTMPGVPFIYYGDEIAMVYQRDLPSKEGGYNRTGSRTPMQWSGGRNAGFSEAASSELYLPIDKNYKKQNVESQIQKSGSLVNKVRKLIRIRKENGALRAEGGFEVLDAKKGSGCLVYIRENEGQKILVIFNPGTDDVVRKIEKLEKASILKLLAGKSANLEEGRLKIPARSFSISLLK